MHDITWEQVWDETARDLSQSWTAGLGHLVTEDVLRFATIKALVRHGVAASHLEAEWRRRGVPDAVDLVITQQPRAAVEFKYPREPRETNAAWTNHLGELLKDFYRLAHMPADFTERWCVQLVSPRAQRYLEGVGHRHGVHIAQHPGHTTVLEPTAVRGLPPTASRLLTRWTAAADTSASALAVTAADPVRARCVTSRQVGDLTLLIHQVHPAAPTFESIGGQAGI